MALKDQLVDSLLGVFKTFSGDVSKDINTNIYQNIFGFYSPTGGTGLTTFVANLAAVLATHKKVAVLDLDLYYPSQFMYLLEDDGENDALCKDILDKFLATGSDITSFGHQSKIPNIMLFSALPDNDITRLCNISYDGVKTCIHELSRLYDYVLIDIKGTLNDEAVIAAIECSTRVYSFIRSSTSDIERLCKITDILSSYNFGAKTQNVIVSPVSSAPSAKEFSEYGLNFVMAIPYVKKVEDVGYNFDIFVNVDGGSNKQALAYIECCKYLAERIVNYGLEGDVEDGT